MTNKGMQEMTGKEGEPRRKRGSYYRALGLAAAAMLLLAALLAGCGSSNKNNSLANRDTASSKSSSSSGSAMANEALPYEYAANDQYGGNAEVAATSAQDAAMTAPAAGQGTAAEPSVTAAMDRKLIYNANVSMEVEHYGDAQTELFNIVALSGGYMLSFSDNQTNYELGGVFVVKVPSNGFQSFLSQLEELKKGNKFQRSVRAQDVTEEYVDLESRLKAKQVVESRLLSFMDKAINSTDLLSYSNELANVQEQIEQLKGRMRYIDQNVAYSTVEVRMYEKLEGGKLADDPEARNAIERAAAALKGSAKAVVTFLEGLLVVLAGAIPILILLAIVAIPLIIVYRKTRYRRNHSKRQGASREADTEETEEKR